VSVRGAMFAARGKRVAEAKRPLRGPLRKSSSKRWSRHPDDWYVEPPWVTEQLFLHEIFEGCVVDPACGLGHIVTAARLAGLTACGTDIKRRAAGFGIADFFQVARSAPNIVSNPPFRFAMAFTGHALNLAERKVALLMPASWVQAEGRSRWLSQTPLRRIWLLTPRPSMPPGPAFVSGEGPRGNGTTDYAWLVWERGYTGAPEIGWLRRNTGTASPVAG